MLIFLRKDSSIFTIFQYGEIFVICTILNGLSYSPKRNSPCNLSAPAYCVRFLCDWMFLHSLSLSLSLFLSLSLSLNSNLRSSCFDMAQGRMNGAPNQTRTHSCSFASQTCQPKVPSSLSLNNYNILRYFISLYYSKFYIDQKTLFYATINRDSVSSLRFPLRNIPKLYLMHLFLFVCGHFYKYVFLPIFFFYSS